MNEKKLSNLLRQGGLALLMVCGEPSDIGKVERLCGDSKNPGWTKALKYEDGRLLFLYSTHRSISENESAIAVCIGLARDAASGSVIGAKELMRRGICTPTDVDHSRLTGNYLILSVDKREPRACLFRSLAGSNTLYFYQGQDLFVCSDDIRLLFPFLARLELDAEALLSHMLFRSVMGRRTYLRSIQRLEHGHRLRWVSGNIQDGLVQTLETTARPELHRLSDAEVDAFGEHSERMIRHYLEWLLREGGRAATLLSGGIDSGLLQHWINQEWVNGTQPRSWSYRVAIPEFDHEAQYALEASDALQTLHEAVTITAEQYPHLLRRSIEIAGAPVAHESMPCHLALAEAFSERFGEISHVIIGVAGDTLHGMESAKRLLQIESLGRIPKAAWLLDGTARILGPVLPNKAYGARELARWLRGEKDPLSPLNPWNAPGLFSDLPLALRCFGPDAVRRAFVERRERAREYLHPSTLTEGIHTLCLVTFVADDQPVIGRLYGNYRVRVLYPYLDWEFIQRIFTLRPKLRYCVRGRTKPIFKRILEKETPYPNVDKHKGHSGFNNTLFAWMAKGPLRDMVHSIERPSFISKEDFIWKIDNPDWFIWNLLTLDYFKRDVL